MDIKIKKGEDVTPENDKKYARYDILHFRALKLMGNNNITKLYSDNRIKDVFFDHRYLLSFFKD